MPLAFALSEPARGCIDAVLQHLTRTHQRRVRQGVRHAQTLPSGPSERESLSMEGESPRPPGRRDESLWCFKEVELEDRLVVRIGKLADDMGFAHLTGP